MLIEVRYLNNCWFVTQEDMIEELWDLYIHVSNVAPDSISIFHNPPG